MTKIVQRFRAIAEWGVEPTTPVEQARHFRLTNVLLVFLFVASLIETAICFGAGAVQAGILNSTAPLVFGGGLLLMRARRTTLARVLVISVSCVAAYALTGMLGRESYFQFIFVFASAFSVVFFTSTERYLLVFGLVVPLLCFVALEVTDYAPVFGMSATPLGPRPLVAMRGLSVLMIWALMVLHFFYFIRDRRRSQEQLVTSAKMVAVGRIAAAIAHEVNNPLQLIVSHAERLKKRPDPGQDTAARAAEVSDQIQAVAMRIAAISKGFLTLSRDAKADPLVEIEIRSVISLGLSFYQASFDAQRVELIASEIPHDWRVIGRETQLAEVITNVLNNAYDAVLEREVRWIRIAATASDTWVEIAISNSGAPVEAKLRRQIFEPFFTTKPIGKGTGLGLSICASIMSAHAGEILYDPSARDACFLIRIPRALPSANRSATQAVRT